MTYQLTATSLFQILFAEKEDTIIQADLVKNISLDFPSKVQVDSC